MNRSCVRLLAGAVVCGSLALAAGCRSSAETTTASATTTVPPKAGGSVNFGLEADPNGLDPARNAFDAPGKQVATNVFDTWTTLGADGSAQPYLAERLDHNADFTVWTLHLRAGVQFHDGSALDAGAAVRSFDAFRSSPITGVTLAAVKATEAVDPLTVRITLSSPWGTFPAMLYSQIGMPMAKAQIEDPLGQSHPIGTGPFELETWDLNQSMRLVRNPHYWRSDASGTALPYLDSVTFKVMPDGQGRISALQRGDLDVIQTRSIADNNELDKLAGNPSYKIAHDPGMTESAFIALNSGKAPLDDLRVRQAVAYATDVRQLAADNGWPTDKLLDGPFAKGTPWHADVAYPGYDLAKAKALIADYEADTGKQVDIELTSPFDTKVLQEIVDQWGAAGISAHAKVVDARVTVINAVFGQYDAVFFSYYGYTDPDEHYFYWSGHSAAPVGSFSVNFSRQQDPAMDAALDRVHASPDPTVRKEALAVVQQRMADLVPYVWLYQLDWVIATRANVYQAHNVTLPDGSPAMPYRNGVFSLAETYVA